MLEDYFLMVWNHYISPDVITLFNFSGIFILVWSSDSLTVSPGLSTTWTKPLKFQVNHFANPSTTQKTNRLQMYFPLMAKVPMDLGGDFIFFLQ